ncbi:unnamed protein product, partial [Pylaiella littoralis]
VYFLDFEDPGQAFAVQEYTQGEGLVVKRMRRTKKTNEFAAECFRRELDIVSSYLSPDCHENIVKYLWVNVRVNPSGIIIMEAMEFD